MPARPHVLLLWCEQMQANRFGTVDPVAHTPFRSTLRRDRQVAGAPPVIRSREAN